MCCPNVQSRLPDALRASWCAETADHPERWSVDEPARFQCGATALVVRELLGGEILIAEVFERGTFVERHAWNRLPDGTELDYTREQFAGREVELVNVAVAEPRCDSHPLLLERVRRTLRA